MRSALHLAGLSFFALATHTHAVGPNNTLNDTGWDYYGATFDQDGRFGRDAAADAGRLPKAGEGPAGFDFIKVARNGSFVPSTTPLGTDPTDWACTYDNVTGLMWQVFGTTSTNWYNSNTATNGGATGGCGGCARSGTEVFVESINAAGLCGHNDWRMPTAKEVMSVADFNNYDAGSVSQWLPSAPGWSSTPSASDPAAAWRLFGARMTQYGKSGAQSTVLVRDGR